MLHRFATDEQREHRLHTTDVAATLEWIRRRRYRTLDVADLIAEVVDGRTGGLPAVAFTIDDGYDDQASIGIPLFLQYDCPVTTFLATGFLDRLHWMWYDQIEMILQSADASTIELELPDGIMQLRLGDQESRNNAVAALVARCKAQLSIDGRAVAAQLAERLQVSIPIEAPRAYAPMTWEDARRLEAKGARFGAHTVWHPVLSHLSVERAASEIQESRERVSRELRNPSPVFCYPFGGAADFRPDEIDACKQSGFAAAVTAMAGYPTVQTLGRDPAARFRVPRFPYESGRYSNLQIINGFERLLHGAQF